MKGFLDIYKIISIFTGLQKNKICNKCIFFLGSMPIGFSRKHFFLINFKDYSFLEKSDGVRYIVSISSWKFSLIGRENNITNLENNAIKSNLPNNVFDFTFLDGELCKNLISQKFQILVYDVISFTADWRVSTWDLISRLKISEIIVKMRNLYTVGQRKDFFLKKDHYIKNNIHNLFKKISNNKINSCHIYYNCYRFDKIICNKNDGLVLAPVNLPYFSRNFSPTFKWKYYAGTTIDLHKKKVFTKNRLTSNYFRVYLSCLGFSRSQFLLDITRSPFLGFKNFTVSIQTKKIPIIEFNFNRILGKWLFIKNRKDKIKPNSFRVLYNTLEIVSELLSQNEIKDKIVKNNTKQQRGKSLRRNI
jgi:hypothetical protein